MGSSHRGALQLPHLSLSLQSSLGATKARALPPRTPKRRELRNPPTWEETYGELCSGREEKGRSRNTTFIWRLLVVYQVLFTSSVYQGENVGYVPQLIVKLQLRTTGSGLSEYAEWMQVALKHLWGCPTPGGQGSIHRMLWLKSVTSFIFFLMFPNTRRWKSLISCLPRTQHQLEEDCLVQTKASSLT